MTNSSINEIIAGMQRELTNSQDKSESISNLVQAADYLQAAMEILEEKGMMAKADQILQILIKIAKNEKQHIDPHTKGLTPDKMVKNLLNHGTEFNMTDDNDNDDLLNLDLGDDELQVSDLELLPEMDFEDEI